MPDATLPQAAAHFQKLLRLLVIRRKRPSSKGRLQRPPGLEGLVGGRVWKGRLQGSESRAQILAIQTRRSDVRAGRPSSIAPFAAVCGSSAVMLRPAHQQGPDVRQWTDAAHNCTDLLDATGLAVDCQLAGSVTAQSVPFCPCFGLLLPRRENSATRVCIAGPSAPGNQGS